MSLFSRWLNRSIDRRVARSFAASPVGQAIRQKFLLDLRQQPRYADPKRLAHSEHQVFSQGGEDGILREIFRRIGETDRTFVEIGAGNGIENNTTFLLLQGWHGVWLEGSAKNCAKIRASYAREIEDARLALVEAMITAENVGALLRDRLQSTALDLLSIDVDRNTYQVWAALDALKPRVAVIEYNAQFPADMHWTVEYDANKWWNGTFHFGASLKALELLGARLGYCLVGCDLAGANAFFVRHDVCADHFCAPFTSENHYEPVRYYLHGRSGHPPAFRD